MSVEKPTDSEKKKIFENKLVTPASSINQINGLQKTQLVDSSNEEVDFSLLNVTIPDSLLLDGFGNLKTSQEAGCYQKSDIEFYRFSDKVRAIVKGEKEWELAYTATTGCFIIDTINGVAPISNSDLYTKLTTLIA